MIVRSILVLILLVAPVTSTSARESTRAYTCEALKTLVNQRGSIVLDTTSNRVYERFVSSRSQCAVEQVTRNYSVPTKTGRCDLKICIDRQTVGGR